MAVMQGCTESESELLILDFCQESGGIPGSGRKLQEWARAGGLEGRGSALLGFLARPPLCSPSFLPWPLAPRFPSSRAKGATA